MKYSPVMNGTGNWQVGSIEDHQARPLTLLECEVVCAKLNEEISSEEFNQDQADGGPAFPIQDWNPKTNSERTEFGMSLRDYFAAKAMQSYCCATDEDDWPYTVSDPVTAVAVSAYVMADAMLKARVK